MADGRRLENRKITTSQPPRDLCRWNAARWQILGLWVVSRFSRQKIHFKLAYDRHLGNNYSLLHLIFLKTIQAVIVVVIKTPIDRALVAEAVCLFLLRLHWFDSLWICRTTRSATSPQPIHCAGAATVGANGRVSYDSLTHSRLYCKDREKK